MVEIWKQCSSAPDYIVSSLGRVMREKAGRGARPFTLLKQFIPRDGRPTVSVRTGGATKTFRVCNLVVEAFHGPRPGPGDECCHNDGHPENNAATNLRWDSRTGNFSDMLLHGTRLTGERHHMAKLTQQQVAEIRSFAAAGVRQKVIGAGYGISQTQVSRIVHGKRW